MEEQEKEEECTQDNEEAEDLVSEIQGEGGFEVKNRSYYFRTYKDCFVASEAVDWLVNKKRYSRSKAVSMCEELRKAGVFEHVSDSTKVFKDENLFFQFTNKPKVVIIGAGFAGSKLAKKLQGHFTVILIDKKSFFVCLPSLPACVCDPDHMDSIRADHSKYLKHYKLINDVVTEVDSEAVYLQSGKRIAFDYLVMCTGSHYNVRLKGNDKVRVVNAIDPDDVLESYATLKEATDVVVIGGGPVGVEVAGEIAHYFPQKNLTIVHGPEKFLERTAPKSNKNIRRFFNGYMNVKCLLGEKVTSLEKDGFLLTDKGTSIHADIVYVCVGFVPNTDFLQKNFKHCLTDNGLDNIYAIGDITSLKEEKLAQTAERHAELLAANLIGFKSHKVPQPYKVVSRIMIVSLGPKKAMIIKGPDVYLEGVLASKMKQLVEFKIMRGL